MRDPLATEREEDRIMRYTDLTLHQRISLKGEFKTNSECACYGAIMALWDFVIAIEFFLNDDISILTEQFKASMIEN